MLHSQWSEGTSRCVVAFRWRVWTAGMVLGVAATIGHAGPGDPLGIDFRVNTATVDDQTTWQRAVAQDAEGRFVVVWEEYLFSGIYGIGGDVWGRRFDVDGTPIGGDFLVNTVTTGTQSVPAVAMDSDGDFVVVWQDDSGSDGSDTRISGQRFDASGAPVGTEFQVNTVTTDNQFRPAVAVDADGNFVVVWEDHSDADGSYSRIAGQRYDATGTPLGVEFQVNTVTTGFQLSPSVAMDMDGDFVVAWDGGGDIAAQRYDATGAPLGAEFQVNNVTTGAQDSPAVAMDADGAFTVVWQDRSNFLLSEQDVAGRQFDNAGTAIGDQFLVNTVTLEDQSQPEIGMDSEGRFVAVWRDEGGAARQVKAQLFDSAGARLGGEFEVPTDTTHNKLSPSVAMGLTGVVAVWTSFLQDGDLDGVYARRFEGVAGGDVGITGKKLIVVDKLTAASKAKIAYVAKDPSADKGLTSDPTRISATLDYQIPTLGAAGSAVMPEGAEWLVNKETVAKYVNKEAPTGGAVKVGVIKGIVAINALS